jgi:hypothetical protein
MLVWGYLSRRDQLRKFSVSGFAMAAVLFVEPRRPIDRAVIDNIVLAATPERSAVWRPGGLWD